MGIGWASGGASDGCGGPGSSGTRRSAYRRANSGRNIEGPSGTRGGASRGACTGCKEEKVGQRLASDGAHDSACRGTDNSCSGHGASGGASGSLVPTAMKV
jgi:hypothetical protein